MLEKIAEINVENKFNSRSRNKYLHRLYRENSSRDDNNEHDSLLLSPAFKMASKFHLKIKQIVKESSDKFFVKFELNDFRFEINVNLNKLYEYGLVQLNSTREVFHEGEVIQISFWSNCNLDKISGDNDIIISTSALEKFIRKVIDLGTGANLNIYSEASLKSLTEGIEYKLSEELFNICSIAIRFFEKLHQENISEKFGTKDEEERFFAIQLVKQNKI